MTMAWPFRKKIPAQVVDVQTQIAHALAEIKSISAPQARARWSLSPRKRADWDFLTAVSEGYNVSAIVYACVEKRAKLLASVPWVAKERVGGELVARPDSRLQQLIDRPNGDVSFYELMYNASQSLDLNGMSFLSLTRAGTRGLPTEIWYLPPTHIKVQPGSVKLVDRYYHHKTPIEPEDMAALRMPNPTDPVFGQPVLMSAGRAADVDRESGIWQKTSLENRGAADLNIKLPEGATQEQVEAAKKQYKEQQAGPKNARKVMVTNAEFQQLNQTAVEMDFVASRRAVWTEICAVFGMSLSNLGMTEDVNLANAEAMDRQLWKNTIIPQLELIERQLTHQLANQFGPNWVIQPDLTNVEALQENRTALVDDAVKLFGMGVPFDQINQKLELGFEEFRGSDLGYVPSGLIPTTFNVGDDSDEAVDDAFGSEDDAE